MTSEGTASSPHYTPHGCGRTPQRSLQVEQQLCRVLLSTVLVKSRVEVEVGPVAAEGVRCRLTGRERPTPAAVETPAVIDTFSRCKYWPVSRKTARVDSTSGCTALAVVAKQHETRHQWLRRQCSIEYGSALAFSL